MASYKLIHLSKLPKNLSTLSGNTVRSLQVTTVRNMDSLLHSENNLKEFKTLQIKTPKPFVYHVELHRPNRLNAFNYDMWVEIKECFESLGTNPDCRAIVLSAAGKHFTAGIDLTDMMKLGQELAEIDDIARKGAYLERLIKLYQDSLSSLEECPKPVIAAVHAACVGAGTNMASAADIRYCSKDAFFQVKEAAIGMAADVGALQRLPKAIGSESLARELCFTARRMESAEAHSCGFVSKVYPDRESTIEAAIKIAEEIAEKSPLAVQATKKNMVYSRSRPNQEGLDHIRAINKLYLLSEDFANAAAAQLTKGEKPTFAKL